MSLKPNTKCREYKEGRIGRYRWYVCRKCGDKYRVFAGQPVSEKERLCNNCEGGQACPRF